MKALEIAAEMCAAFEGLSLTAYVCPAGYMTIGFGSTRYLDGRPVAQGDKITRADAEELLLRSLASVYLPAVQRHCAPALPSDNRTAALLDFAYNIGSGALQTSTLARKVRMQDWDGAAAEFPRWNKGGGRVLPGLVRRRAAERQLFEAA
jgi:lysozyme